MTASLGESWLAPEDPLPPATTVSLRDAQFISRHKPFVAGFKVPLPDDDFLEMPVRYPSLNAPFDDLEPWLSWPLNFPQSCRPVGGGQTALLTLAEESQLTATQRNVEMYIALLCGHKPCSKAALRVLKVNCRASAPDSWSNLQSLPVLSSKLTLLVLSSLFAFNSAYAQTPVSTVALNSEQGAPPKYQKNPLLRRNSVHDHAEMIQWF